MTIEQEILAAMTAGTQTVGVIIALVNQWRNQKNLPPLTPQEMHDKTAKTLDDIDAANKS